ncbi:FAD-binding oxidoreductase [Shimia sp. NS0008-38b]|uniref:NAD(P)/FAD-dependent oxidoreductase n=1 Tax=Shimia sp. NS0008-38b TaxID=3127653 RepID=UPI003102A829
MAFDTIVVGAGLWGSACARHLAEMGAKVALIGPKEPAQAATHTGVFGSHYDQARITRRLDRKQDWSRFAARSMERYGEIESASGTQFFHASGYLLAAPTQGGTSDAMAENLAVAKRDGVEHIALDSAGLKARFPFFGFPTGIAGLFEPGGGWINPRVHVIAEITVAQARGVTLLRTEAVGIEETVQGVVVRCADGQHVAADKVVVACGAFSKVEELLPEPLPLKVYARTTALLEIDAAETARLKDMPSVVYYSPDGKGDCYVLPPVSYPDGKTYLKLGGDPEDNELTDVAQMKDWFRSGGSAAVGEHLREVLLGMIPGLSYRSVSYQSCATSFTPRGNPLVYGQSDRIFVLAGGNGAGAKCADEMGRVAAVKLRRGDASAEGYETDFLP